MTVTCTLNIMKYIILLTIGSILIISALSAPYTIKKRVFYNIQISNTYEPSAKSLYISSITGNKKGLSRKLKKTFQNYGLLHLMTPSGIHLSSIIVLIKFHRLFAIFFMILILCFLQKYDTYNSMERILIFRLISSIFPKVINPHYIFISTLIIAVFIGHYHNSPLSLCFSLLFWGTIILFKENKIKLIFFLNFTLLFTSSLMDHQIAPSSILINPLFTFIYSLFFPVLFINLLLPSDLNLDIPVNFFLNSLIDTLTTFQRFDPFPLVKIKSLTLIIGLILLHFRKFKLYLFILLLNVSDLQKCKINYSPTTIINIPEYQSGDVKCKVKMFRIKCKKKAL